MSSENAQLTASANISLEGKVEEVVKVGRGYLVASYIIFSIFILILYYIDCNYEKNMVTRAMVWTVFIYYMVTIPILYFSTIIEKPLEKMFENLLNK